MAAITVAELNALVPSTVGMDSTRATLLIEGAQKAAENFCNRSFDLESEATEYYDAPAPDTQPEIQLKRWPVSDVAEVRIDASGGGGQIAGTFGTDTIVGSDLYCYKPESGLLIFLGAQSNWPFTIWPIARGANMPYGTNRRLIVPDSIRVTYTGGFTAVPGDVKLALAQLVAWLDGGAMESGGREVTRYIDVTVAQGNATDELTYGRTPSLASARQILGAYRMPAFRRGRW